MRDITCFSANTVAQFENDYDNMLQFNGVLLDASSKVYSNYSKEESDTIIRNQFDKILNIDFKNATPMKRRQAWRDHGKEIASLIEDVIVDKMNSGWTEANAKFMEFVEEVNIANGDVNEFYVEDHSLLQVSEFAGNHHNIIRQAVKPGKSFRVDTSWYVIKVYGDYEAFQLGKIDFASMVDRMYRSIEDYRYNALYTAFMAMDKNLPGEMKLETAISGATKDAILDQIEAVKAATGREVILIGTRTAISKLQSTVDYNMFSDAMKNERNNNGMLGIWEGYECVALSRVNKTGTLESVFSADDNKKIFIMPIDPENKPIKRVNAGDVMYIESGMDGTKKDMTADIDIRYQEGIGVVINQLFGEIIAM